MNPLSPWTFYRRHKRHAALLLCLTMVVTVGLYSLAALVWGIFVDQPRQCHMGLSRFSMVTMSTETQESGDHGSGPAAAAELTAWIRANPDVARIVPTTAIKIEIPGLLPGDSLQLDVFGLMAADVPYVLERLGATLEKGRLPEPATNELLLSQDVATMLEVEVGDTYHVMSSEFYAGVDIPLEATPFDVVGVLKSDVELGIASLEFLNDHALYRNFPARFLVAARPDRDTAVAAFLQEGIQTPGTAVMTLEMLNERLLNEALPGLVMLAPVVLLVAIAFSLVVVVVNRIANARRLSEFGILHATGLSKQWLIRRLTAESTGLALVGWVVGIGLAWSILYLLKVTVFATRGYDLNFVAWVPVLFALPVPAMIAGFTNTSTARTLSRLDPVAVVERGELSQEGDGRRAWKTSKSSPKPLASLTFYRRYRRRAVLLVAGMSLMILAVVLFIMALTVDADAQIPFLGYLSQASVVRSPGIFQSLDSSVVARIENHPAVERVIPIAPRNSMLRAAIPPFTSAEASPFGVYADDMVYLVEHYGLELEEGHLPRPGTNEMVIPKALAQNRGIHVGDAIGDPRRPAYPGAPALPLQFVISGIFAPPSAAENGNGLGFISLEFLESEQAFLIPDSPPLIVVPKSGQKGILDDWLELELAGPDASVFTYRREIARVREDARQDMIAIALLEAVLAAVAASGLAVLNYIFFSQRQPEFAVLNALGYGRLQLVRRVLRETTLATGIAWGSSVIVCLLAMVALRLVVFEPLGLTFQLTHLGPWLYTLPIPVAVLATTAGTTAWTLSKIDPVSIIERR